MNIQLNHAWPYIVSIVFIVCTTAIIALSLILKQDIPSYLLLAGGTFLGSIGTFVFGAIQQSKTTTAVTNQLNNGTLNTTLNKDKP